MQWNPKTLHSLTKYLLFIIYLLHFSKIQLILFNSSQIYNNKPVHTTPEWSAVRRPPWTLSGVNKPTKTNRGSNKKYSIYKKITNTQSTTRFGHEKCKCHNIWPPQVVATPHHPSDGALLATQLGDNCQLTETSSNDFDILIIIVSLRRDKCITQEIWKNNNSNNNFTKLVKS